MVNWSYPYLFWNEESCVDMLLFLDAGNTWKSAKISSLLILPWVNLWKRIFARNYLISKFKCIVSIIWGDALCMMQLFLVLACDIFNCHCEECLRGEVVQLSWTADFPRWSSLLAILQRIVSEPYRKPTLPLHYLTQFLRSSEYYMSHSD